MDIERTMEFILQTQVKVEARLDRMSERQDLHDRRMQAMDENIRRLVRLGVQEVRVERRRRREMAAEWDERMKRTDQSIAQLASKIDAFVDAMRQGRNGRT